MTCQIVFAGPSGSQLGLSPASAGLSFGNPNLGMLTRKGNPMNWPLMRIGLLIAALANTFSLGRLSIEFGGTGSDWTVLILSVVGLIGILIGLATGELVGVKPKGN